MTGERRSHLQLRVLPARDAAGRGKARRDARAAGAARAQVLLRDLWRRRLDSRPHACDGAGDPGVGTARRAAHLVHRLDAGEHPPDARDLSRARHRPPGRACAATCLPAAPTRVNFATPSELVEFIRRRQRRLVSHRCRLLPRVSPAGEESRGRPRELQAQGRRRRELGDHAVLLQRQQLLSIRR